MEQGAGFDKHGDRVPREEWADLEPKIFEILCELEAQPFKRYPSFLSIPISTNKLLPSVVQAPKLD